VGSLRLFTVPLAARGLLFRPRMMLRITELVGDGGDARLAVEGRVTARTVAALEQACVEAMKRHPALDLDVSQVQFADAVGLDFLRRLDGDRVRLVGCTGFLRELLQTTPTDTLERSTR